jgi:hypothetical protein
MMKAVVAALCCWGVAYATPIATLTLFPNNGNVTGQPLDGYFQYTITNNTDFWLLATSSNFCEIGADPNLVDCTQTYNGTTQFGPKFGYWVGGGDLAVTEFPTPPHSTNFYFTPPIVGIYIVGFGHPDFGTDSGNIFVHFAEYIGDPTKGGVRNPNDPGNLEMSAPATLTFVPEPGTLLLALPALIAMGLLRLRRTRRA